MNVSKTLSLLILTLASSPTTYALVLANTANIPVAYEVLKFDQPTTPDKSQCSDNPEGYIQLLSGQIKRFHESRAPYVAFCYKYQAHLNLTTHVIGNIKNTESCVVDFNTTPNPACDPDQ